MFKISTLLKNLLGFGNWLTASIVEGDGGGSMSLDQQADAFGSFFGDDEQQAAAPAEQAQAAADDAAPADADGAQDAGADDAAQDGDDAAPESFTIEVDGKPVTLTAAEMAEAYKGQLRQADYTKKTMEAAEERKAAAAVQEKARTERDTYAQKLGQFVTAESAVINEAAALLTDDLLDADPQEYLRLQRTLQQRQAKLQQAHAEHQQIEQQRQAEHEQAARDHIAQQLDSIHAKLPAWKDQAVMSKEVGEIKEHLMGRGFTEADFAGMQDYRIVLMARDAMLHARILDKAKEATKKLANVPSKAERPGTPTGNIDGRTTAARQFQKSGSKEDAARLFGQLYFS